MTFRARTIWGLILCTIFLASVMNSCRKSRLERRTTPLQFVAPDGFPEPVYDFSANPLTEEAFALGKKLFYESRLAAFQDVNCGSCHQQLAAYTTFDHDLGHGTNFQHTTRNVPVIFNMAWQREFGWDGGTKTLEGQILACLKAPERMAETVEGLRNKLDSASEYRQMFTDAFGDPEITEERLSKAVAQFVAMIVSAESKYDRVKQGRDQFNSSEAAGYELFKTNCATCHAEPLFTDLSYRNIGLAHRDGHEDKGRMQVSGNGADSLKFKVPSLRNVSISSYYIHDGRFAGISEVLNHYTSPKEQTQTLDPLLQPDLELTNLEKFYLHEFLNTLADSTLVNDQRFR
jgi:cytochrome c peroxidase